MIYRVVFDTNVLFSAVGWGGVPGVCVELAAEHRIELVTSAYILGELADNLGAKLGWDWLRIEAVLASLLTFSTVTNPQVEKGVASDPDDDPILACALDARASYLVTGSTCSP